MSEQQFSDNINKLRECEGPLNESCNKAFKEAMDFMKENGPIAQKLSESGKVRIDGNSLTFDSSIYPKKQ
ncbi:MAG: hypothetical protein K2X77_00265 [Candidatus Obscuribacterales bacterium]|jgi:hypothetical protein|nr:hypothetical protein [Candidatus Obscuribacterales bacterium]